MPRYDIEQWEKETAEIEIRRWLDQIGQWAPDVEMDRLRLREGEPLSGALNRNEIDQLLHTEIIGRIGCFAEGKPYVVPIVYAYDGKAIYGHSGDGMKVRMMRQNPYVCFQVEHVDSLTNWKSVIVWGHFEELQGDAAEQALQLLVDRLKPRMEHEPFLAAYAGDRVLQRNTVTYRIVVEKRTGRFAQQTG